MMLWTMYIASALSLFNLLLAVERHTNGSADFARVAVAAAAGFVVVGPTIALHLHELGRACQ